MNIELDMPVGKWRELTSKELKDLNKLLVGSQKTYTPDENTPQKPIAPKKKRKRIPYKKQ